jgi:hypothetical protein
VQQLVHAQTEQDAYQHVQWLQMLTVCAVTCCVMQAHAVIDGLPADVVVLTLLLDVQRVADAGLLRQDWGLDAGSSRAGPLAPSNPCDYCHPSTMRRQLPCNSTIPTIQKANM